MGFEENMGMEMPHFSRDTREFGRLSEFLRKEGTTPAPTTDMLLQELILEVRGLRSDLKAHEWRRGRGVPRP